ncbi:uncharacterized protein LOC131931701 [Physella acuta]|uniref:uncharacterized protein LOC131931701 n=1 Tax=Physella acuta TaxID=109671 RepID=UPI0027DC175A|nr:uncharacterized protein LOC131931701 [Physella acuta]XP_059144503.1 uncharacterized protein LOC131931701 [Physella acuta]XP_059144504.1 uncharacterized protein LOC131931701 [Physella acuta]XP_059144505.1 uncharacterized protein LOC131931701 [Physella acuta]XP_059144506.1 uncharacterized protein LOC131931701 [Physella acuta]XP_059144507.1 uncharacterized protein LOC131931701 [Physella acuta]XP_059144508.1 uncharacterized protein LOC131931701 [Physella acuta]XP_059144509.1 uncharacterized p
MYQAQGLIVSTWVLLSILHFYIDLLPVNGSLNSKHIDSKTKNVHRYSASVSLNDPFILVAKKNFCNAEIKKNDINSYIMADTHLPTLNEAQNKEIKMSKFITSNFIRRSMEGLEEILDNSRVKVFEKIGGVMNQMVHSKDQVMKGFDNVMDKVSESVSESSLRVKTSFNTVLDKMSKSKDKMMVEIDNVIDNLSASKVLSEIRALPREIQDSFLLGVRNRSYVAAGVMVAATTAILVAGAVYYAWCHQDAWNYQIVPVEDIAYATGDVIKHCGTRFADGSATSKGITSCFISSSITGKRLMRKHSDNKHQSCETAVTTRHNLTIAQKCEFNAVPIISEDHLDTNVNYNSMPCSDDLNDCSVFPFAKLKKCEELHSDTNANSLADIMQ